MTKINPNEAPQEENRPEPQATKTGWNKEISGITVAFIFQLVVLVFMLINRIASALSYWGTDIQGHAWYALIAGAIAGLIGIGILIAAKRQNKSGWVLFEGLTLVFLVVGILPGMINQLLH